MSGHQLVQTFTYDDGLTRPVRARAGGGSEVTRPHHVYEPLAPADGYAALDWLVRVCAPVWLDAAGLTADAAGLRSLAPLLDPTAVRDAAETVRAAQSSAYRVSGVVRWHDVDAHRRPYGAMPAYAASLTIGGHQDPDACLAASLANWAWGACAYAAHAVPDPEHARVVAALTTTPLPSVTP